MIYTEKFDIVMTEHLWGSLEEGHYKRGVLVVEMRLRDRYGDRLEGHPMVFGNANVTPFDPEKRLLLLRATAMYSLAPAVRRKVA